MKRLASMRRLILAGITLQVLFIGCVLIIVQSARVEAKAVTTYSSPQSELPQVTATPTPNCTGLVNYTVSQATGATVVPGTIRVTGSRIDLPFPFRLYGQFFNAAYVGLNGTLSFVPYSDPANNTCLPSSDLTYAILPHWDTMYYDPEGGISPQ